MDEVPGCLFLCLLADAVLMRCMGFPWWMPLSGLLFFALPIGYYHLSEKLKRTRSYDRVTQDVSPVAESRTVR
jgi:hypothetical protein